MIHDHGFQWTDEDTDAGGRAARVWWAERASVELARRCTSHRTVVQAGGHVGLWPVAFAQHFATVFTFEPAPSNWACLEPNVERAPNVYPFHAALGEAEGMVSVSREGTKDKSGLWYVVPSGTIPMLTIDSFGLSDCDAIVLDVEGHELPAFKGAEQTIARCHPVIWFEAIDHLVHRVGTSKDVMAWLRARGYGEPDAALKRDVVMTWEGR